MRGRKISTLIALTLCFILLVVYTQDQGIGEQRASSNSDQSQKVQLRFKADGTFKIVQFADSQDGSRMDARTLSLMEKILDYEKPDLVIYTGDNINGKNLTKGSVKRSIDNIAQPVEKRNIPWAVVFGNHDEDQIWMSKEDMMKLYISYPSNLSSMGPGNVDGVGNYNLLVNDSKNKKPVFNLYFLDSGTYAPKKIGTYAWIKFSQIAWYRQTAQKLVEAYGRKIPALMFFHIPLQEFKEAFEVKKLTGTRNESESPPALNSGLFTSLVEMGDVKGVFAGHDHINDYVAELKGIKLGFSRSIGYAAYGKEGFDRGARVFLIKESNPGKFETWMRVESDFTK